MRGVAGLLIGWTVGFCTLWFTGWGPQVGGMWAGGITSATMFVGFAIGLVLDHLHA
jgi:hypothetical protein